MRETTAVRLVQALEREGFPAKAIIYRGSTTTDVVLPCDLPIADKSNAYFFIRGFLAALGESE